MTKLNINGKSVDVDVDPEMPLLWVLRDVLGLTGTKYGCGEALCGACTVHLDGKVVRSCVTPVRQTRRSGPLKDCLLTEAILFKRHGSNRGFLNAAFARRDS